MTADPRQERNVETGPLYEAGTAAPVSAGFPADHSREAKAMTALKRRGFTAEFIVDSEMLRVAGSGERFTPEDVRIRDFYRFEGTSDPSDMSVIYAIEANDGTRGTLTDAYGTYADPAVGAMLARMAVDRRSPSSGWRRALIPAGVAALTVLTVVAILRRRRA
jgi:hypothetical protein